MRHLLKLTASIAALGALLHAKTITAAISAEDARMDAAGKVVQAHDQLVKDHADYVERVKAEHKQYLASLANEGNRLREARNVKQSDYVAAYCKARDYIRTLSVQQKKFLNWA